MKTTEIVLAYIAGILFALSIFLSIWGYFYFRAIWDEKSRLPPKKYRGNIMHPARGGEIDEIKNQKRD